MLMESEVVNRGAGEVKRGTGIGVHKVKEEKIKKVKKEEFSHLGMEKEMKKAMTVIKVREGGNGLEKGEEESSGHRRNS
jgi:hypothetical protein